jgi:hypothetical protein
VPAERVDQRLVELLVVLTQIRYLNPASHPHA